ncbi:uncharacterized protein LOC117785930 [Drosophila innubila]|uniref:uncharacterized protein LOC117785930 n=1 Tax=Drosophila innubila TaxID=198719 RepID=UPI00148DDE15|nr:uncharacterized protein LOC117785930 [Drosophila innubila]
MPPGCWLQASQPAGAEAAAAVVGLTEGAGVGAAASSDYMQSTASVATLASISSIASTSASAMAALRARPYLVAPYVATASAPPTPQPHAVAVNPMSSARTAPATPTRRREDRTSDPDAKKYYTQHEEVDDVQELGLAVALDEPHYCKPKSQRFFWRKALRRVFQRRK